MSAMGMRPVQAFVPEALVASRVGAWESDDAKRCIVGDATCAWLFGLDPAEAALGVPSSAFSAAIVPEDRARYAAEMGRLVSEGGLYVMEYRTQPTPGVEHWVLARGHFAYDPARASMIGKGIVIDITGYKSIGHAEELADFHRLDSEVPPTPLDEAADHAVATRQAIDRTEEPDRSTLRKVVDALLLAIARALVRRGD